MFIAIFAIAAGVNLLAFMATHEFDKLVIGVLFICLACAEWAQQKLNRAIEDLLATNERLALQVIEREFEE